VEALMYNLYLLARVILLPFLKYVLPLFSKQARTRIKFENLNIAQVQNIDRAQFGFEISSEGELEQVKVVLTRLLEEGESVELLFCSPSVEDQCQKIFRKFPNQVRLYRVPILGFNPFTKLGHPGKWMTCEKFIMCRYDFYPELIHYGATKAKEFTLFAATLKNFDSKPSIARHYLKYCYHEFHKIVTVTNCSRSAMEKDLGIPLEKIEVYDFRVVQIIERQEKKINVFKQKLPHSKTFLNFLSNIPSNEKFIFGSYWKNEIDIFTEHDFSKDGKQFFLFPHQLSAVNISTIILDFQNMGVSVFEFNADTTEEQLKDIMELAKTQSIVWVVNLKGLLCEIYTYFDYAFIGGGHGVSVHSLLEPYLANCIVFCGPKIHRSTEHTLIKENSPRRIFVAEEQSEVLELMFLEATHETVSIENFKSHYEGHLGVLLFWLGISKKSDMVC
jgi:3-deoxy-D-manno-octulosonic-acid transferase